MTIDYLGYQPGPGAGSSSRRLFPSKDRLEYLKLALELLLLLLAVPYLLRELARHPGKVSRQAATKHLKGA